MKKIFYFLLLILLISSVFALTPEEKTYFDAQNQKTIAQLNQKIEDTKTQIEKSMIQEFHDSTVFIETEMWKNIRKGIKNLAIAMAGAMILILALFKVIDQRLTNTKYIENYKKELKEQKAKLDQYRKDLDFYKNQLVNYHNELKTKYNVKDEQNIENTEKKNNIVVEKKKKDFNPLIYWIIVIVSAIIAGIIIYFVFIK